MRMSDWSSDVCSSDLEILRAAADALKAQPRAVPQRLAALLADKRKLERELSDLRKQLATGGGAAGPQVKDLNGIKYDASRLDGVPATDLRGLRSEERRGRIELFSHLTFTWLTPLFK